MSQDSPRIELRTSPHLHEGPSVDQIMRNVVWALLPIGGFAVYNFGLSVLVLIAVVVATCLLTEYAFSAFASKQGTLSDFSALITGLLLALTLPPGFPLWMGAVAGFIAIAMGKVLFGGLGCNVFNPALVGRAFVQAAFPVAITTWTPALAPDRFVEFIPSTLAIPLSQAPDVAEWSKQVSIDAWSGATPLALQKFESITSDPVGLALGLVPGSAGETSALLILVCGLYLAARRMLNWRIPLAVLLSAAATAAAFYWLDPSRYPDPLFVVLSGGLMLGAWFMATDMVGSPVTPAGVWIFGALIGFLTVIIRLFGGLNEGVMYAILLANAASPLIEAITQPRVYGERKRTNRS